MDSLGTEFDALLARAASIALVAAVAWTVLIATAVAIEAGTGGRVRMADRTGCPPILRLWLLGVFVTLFAVITPAQASDRRPGSGSADRAAAALDGLALPDRAVGAPTGPRQHGARRIVVVRSGDSLWRIARAHVPVNAPNAAVAAAVQQLHAHNRQVIGPDPDLVLPGQRLDLPPDFPDPTTPPEAP